MTPHPTRHRLPTTALRPSPPYDPWADLRQNWPDVKVVIEPMTDDLLGEVRDDGRLIALRADTSAAQRRCTLTHELVHLERGILDCGPWLQREEDLVHAEASRRLIPLDSLAAGIRELGGADDQGALAHWLDVDSETLAVRLHRMSSAERRALRRALARQAPLWSVA
ncbi:ImmA/IrrE family metallo-endopeptidase [Jatrophihabitans sp.]|uniref:ImmA/IrrE family metallo-endopeptidase n=1 Tax=Jatrophihabitans sp. TaxID=1932789 RepID=UPI002C98545F|nr:ImmA/IrrE family metallo-endopeptidase [Jatrophihabitans sp.]